MNRYIIIFLLIVSIGFTLNAQQSQKKAEALRTDNKINIDGKLREIDWSKAQPANDFVQYSPYNGQSPSEQTEVSFLYDDDALYVGAFLQDSLPGKISKNLGKRDDFNLADYFGVYIDPYNDASKAYGFFVTAAGVQVDVKSTTYNDFQWDAVWKSAVYHTPNGWSVEMRIPYSALRFSKQKNQQWGLNMERFLQRNREKSTWNYVDINTEGMNKQAGLLCGISDIEPPVRLAFIPYMSTYVENENSENSYSIKGGMDVKYGINESFTLDMMLIPDFGQVKSDKEVLNLSPYETYYGEKREFFKEGMELFNRAGIFYSRRIGDTPANVNEAGDVADSLGAEVTENPGTTQLINATKITGKTEKGFNIGILNAMSQKAQATIKDTITGEKQKYTTQPFTNYNVSVFEQTLPGNSFVSLINTNYHRPSDDYTANVTGTELRYEFDEQIAIQGAGALSQQYYQDNPLGHKYWLKISRITGRFRYAFYHNTESPEYDPNDLGYLQSPDERNQYASVSYAIREPFWKLLNWHNELKVRYNTMYDYDDFVSTRIQLSTRATTENHLSFGINSTVKPLQGYDYHEPRVEGYKFKNASWQNGSFWISSDYRKTFALDLRFGGWVANQYDQSGLWYSVSPRLRLGDRFMLIYDFNGNNSFNSIGYVTNNEAQDSVVFGRRNYTKLENNINIDYIFTPHASLSLYLRHYWSRVNYDRYYLLNRDGTLTDHPAYNENEDINYNAFNIDLAYTWQFAPGSEMSLVWKNQILSQSDHIVNSFTDNIDQTFSDPGKNSISVRVLYYLDYMQLKNSLL